MNAAAEAATLRDAITRYHDLLGDDRLAAESWQMLEAGHRSRGMYFGERPLCSVLRPRFLTPAQYREISSGVEREMGAFRRAYDAAMADAAFRTRFHLLDWEETLLSDPVRVEEPSPTGRLDAFFTPDDGALRFTEYNAETPAGPAYMDELSEVMLALPVMGEFLTTHSVRPLPARHGVLHALLRAWKAWGGSRPPQIAVLDWDDVPTRSEHRFFCEYFRGLGLHCELGDPRLLQAGRRPHRRGELPRSAGRSG